MGQRGPEGKPGGGFPAHGRSRRLPRIREARTPVCTLSSEDTSHLVWDWSQTELSWKEGEALRQARVCASAVRRRLVGVPPPQKRPQAPRAGRAPPRPAASVPAPTQAAPLTSSCQAAGTRHRVEESGSWGTLRERRKTRTAFSQKSF